MTIEFSCFDCGQLVKTPASAAGKKGRCPHCGTIVQIPAEAPKPAPPPPPPPPPAPPAAAVAIEFPCPKCNGLVRTPLSAAGKKGRCPHCTTVVQIPGTSPAALAPTTAAPSAAAKKPVPEPVAAKPTPPPPAKPKFDDELTLADDPDHPITTPAPKPAPQPAPKPTPDSAKGVKPAAAKPATQPAAAQPSAKPAAPAKPSGAKPTATAASSTKPTVKPAAASGAKPAATTSAVTKPVAKPTTPGKPAAGGKTIPVAKPIAAPGAKAQQPTNEQFDDLLPLEEEESLEDLPVLETNDLGGLTPLTDLGPIPGTGLPAIGAPMLPGASTGGILFAAMPLAAGQATPFGTDPADAGFLLASDPTLGLPALPPNPYASPGVSLPSASPALGSSFVSGPRERTGLPWDIEVSAAAYWQTAKMLVFSPSQGFAVMHRTGGVSGPLGYALIGLMIGPLGALLLIYLFMMLVLLVSTGNFEAMVGLTIIFAIYGISTSAGMMVSGCIGLLVGAGISHLCLMLVGGATRPYETTFRVLAYTNGSVALIGFIPFIGAIIQIVLTIVLLINGYASAHGISAGRAALAVFLPLIVLGGCIFVGIMMLTGLVAASGPNPSSF